MSLSLFKKRLVTVIAALAFTSFSFAEQAVDKGTIDKITSKMSALQLNVSSVSSSVVDGLYEVITDKGVFYISKNTQFLVHGSIYDFDNQMENVSEKSLVTLRRSKLKEFEKDMIVYKAPEEKHVITVFTDTSCVYCQKLHSEIPDYNKLGITVRYLAFPRGGIKSSAYNTMVSVWCDDDPNMAMDNAKQRHGVELQTCDNNVKEQYELGLFFGVNGTPAIVLEDGSIKPGYVPAKQLIEML